MSEGQTYAEKVEAAAAKLRYGSYDGVAHEFFGTGAAVDKAKLAVAAAALGLKSTVGE